MRMTQKNLAHPKLGGRGGEARFSHSGNIPYDHFIPEALAVFKGGRWRVVAKLTLLDGKPILAVCHRHQHGVESTISLPGVVIAYSGSKGAEETYFRRDQLGAEEMRRITIKELLKAGHLGPGAGAEWYIPISKMERVRWREWPYAEKVVRLGEEGGLNPQIR